MNVLFITATIRSHIIPSFYLANLLSEYYTINYAVENKILKELVESQGFNAFQYEENEGELSQKKEKKESIIKYVLSEIKIKSFKKRRIILEKIITALNPSIIIIDIFKGSDFFILHDHIDKLKIFFFSPMLSTYRIEDYPTVTGESFETENTSKINILNRNFNLRLFFYKILNAYKEKKILNSSTVSLKKSILKYGTFTMLFEGYTQFVLAPLELEYSPDVKKDNQIYLGTCTHKHRVDTELDISFESRFNTIVEKRKLGEKVIYCAFGTFYSGSNLSLLNFLRVLLEAVKKIPNVQLICSVNDIISETLLYQRNIPNNIHFFSRTPQLKVLENTDVFITHGGLGSIKESISYNVPMIVYPLDMSYDMYGNSLKVEYHKIGIKGILNVEQPNSLRDKILNLFEDNSYKENITLMNEKITKNSRPQNQIQIIEKLINT